MSELCQKAEVLPLGWAQPSQQQMARLVNCRTGIPCEHLIGSTANRMANDNELVVRHAKNATHEFSGAGEAFRHHAYSGHPLPLCRYRVVQTAR
jgi:hypothetical protein